MVIKRKNRIRLFFLSTLMMFSMCFFFSNTIVKACDDTPQQSAIAVGFDVIQFEGEGEGDGGGAELPKEITEPIEKGLSLLEYLVVTAGIVVVIIGFVLLGISFFGHQNDMKVMGLIAIGVGAVNIVAPFVANWIAGRK